MNPPMVPLDVELIGGELGGRCFQHPVQLVPRMDKCPTVLVPKSFRLEISLQQFHYVLHDLNARDMKAKYIYVPYTVQNGSEAEHGPPMGLDQPGE